MTSRFEPLFGAQALAAWVREGGSPERKVRAYQPRLWWHARLFEHNWRMQTARMVNASLPEGPIFILGLWRSGTTLFHELLTEVTRWNTPQTWQCFNPSTCFLSAPPSVDRTIDRPMDPGRISSLGPQEDEFAVLLLGEPSLYRAFIDPRRLGECAEQLWSTNGGAQNRDALLRWRAFLCGLNSPATSIPWLLKSPSHSFRIPLMRELFPRAKFVWVGRHTGEVLASNLKMWNAMVASHGLWGCPSGLLEQYLQQMLRACACVLTRCLDEMPQENLLWVDFEELQARPALVLQRVLRFIGPETLGADGADALRVDQALAKIPIHAGSRAPLPTHESAQTLTRLMAAARQRFGYVNAT